MKWETTLILILIWPLYRLVKSISSLKTNDIITSTTGQKVKWFAPPSGSFRPEVVTLASQLKMSTIMWTVDTIDWQKPSSEVLINRVMKRFIQGLLY